MPSQPTKAPPPIATTWTYDQTTGGMRMLSISLLTGPRSPDPPGRWTRRPTSWPNLLKHWAMKEDAPYVRMLGTGGDSARCLLVWSTGEENIEGGIWLRNRAVSFGKPLCLHLRFVVEMIANRMTLDRRVFGAGVYHLLGGDFEELRKNIKVEKMWQIMIHAKFFYSE